MPQWKHTIDCNFMPTLTESLPEHGALPPGTGEDVANRITLALTKVSITPDSSLTDVLDEMRYAEEMYELQDAWDSFYDLCDDRRIWVDTIGTSNEED